MSVDSAQQRLDGPTPGFLAIGECNDDAGYGWSYEMVEAATFDAASAALLDDLTCCCTNDFTVDVLKLWFDQYHQGVASIDVVVSEYTQPHIRYRFAWSPAE